MYVSSLFACFNTFPPVNIAYLLRKTILHCAAFLKCSFFAIAIKDEGSFKCKVLSVIPKNLTFYTFLLTLIQFSNGNMPNILVRVSFVIGGFYYPNVYILLNNCSAHTLYGTIPSACRFVAIFG